MKNKLSIGLTILFAIILVIQFSFIYGLPDWTFTKGSFVIANKLILYASIFGLILCLATLFKAPRWLSTSLTVLFAIFFGLNAFFEINPIDTTTQPIDKEVLSTSLDKKKVIIRQRINTKNNSKILDTVLAKDFGIFRRIYSK